MKRTISIILVLVSVVLCQPTFANEVHYDDFESGFSSDYEIFRSGVYSSNSDWFTTIDGTTVMEGHCLSPYSPGHHPGGCNTALLYSPYYFPDGIITVDVKPIENRHAGGIKGIVGRFNGRHDTIEFGFLEWDSDILRLKDYSSERVEISVPSALNEWSTLSLEMIGGTINGYLNGELVLSLYDVPIRSGYSGMLTRTGKARFDNFTVEVIEPNTPPVAEAGPDQAVEQESHAGTEVTLDGSGSMDPDSTPGTNDDIVSFEWYEGDTFLGTGEVISHTFPLGIHTVALVVTDSEGEPDDDEVMITVEDTTPPEVSVTVNKDSLWPPNHKMVDVGFGFEVSDICDAEPVVSIEVTSDEPTATAPGAGGSKHAPDAEITDDGVLLRAERSGNGDGRVYVITVTASDVSGNSASASASVKVNHNKKKEAVDSGQDYDATQIN
ncbi:MAG: PKD domain-containing protein [Thermodesulfobacteriota bacterium]|nr:PKD domain-containing protein [Thermodesulfobacteriota bacterium]